MKIMKEERPESIKTRMIHRLRFGARVQRGFTLVELLVVIIIIAVLCTIAIPAFLGQREHAQDAAAYSLVRNALTAIQGAFVDTNDYTHVTVADLHAIEPSIDFLLGDHNLVSTTPAAISNVLAASARDHQVEFYPESKTVMDVACKSESGNSFGLQVNTVNIAESGYVKVKVVEGTAALGW